MRFSLENRYLRGIGILAQYPRRINNSAAFVKAGCCVRWDNMISMEWDHSRVDLPFILRPEIHAEQGEPKVRIWSLVLAFVLGTVAVDLMAQNNAATTQTSQIAIAVVDVGHILKNHPTMKADLEKIEANMKQADEEMTRQRDDILKLMEQLREKFTEGTPEYEREEKRIAEMDTQFRLEIVKKRKEFDKARATVLYKIYTDIKGLVAYASEQMGIQVVMRVNGTREDLDPAKPDTVQLLMSQEVIHYTSKVDLTDWVLNGLKQRTASQQGNTTQR